MSPERSDDELLRALEDALADGPDRTPPPDRVAAIRARAAARAAELASTAAPPRARRRDFLVGGIAASIGVAAGLAGAITTDDDGPAAPPMEAIAFTGTPAGARTDASLINHTWGVELVLDVDGLPAGNAYDVTYDGPDGPLTAGSFLAVAVPMHCRFNAARRRDAVTAITITDPDGATVARAELT